MRWAVAFLAGTVGCASGQLHVPQADVAQRLHELREQRRIRAVATNGESVRLSLNRTLTIDQNAINQSPLRAPLAELIAGCVVGAGARLDGYALELEGQPCPLAHAQFLTVGREALETPSRRVGGHLLFWVVFLAVGLVGGLVTLGLCVAGDDRC